MSQFSTVQSLRNRSGQVSSAPVLTSPFNVQEGSEDISASAGAQRLFAATASMLIKNMQEDSQRERIRQVNQATVDLNDGLSAIETDQSLTNTEMIQRGDQLLRSITSRITDERAGEVFITRASGAMRGFNRSIGKQAQADFRREGELFNAGISSDTNINDHLEDLSVMLPANMVSGFQTAAKEIFFQKRIANISNGMFAASNPGDVSRLLSNAKSVDSLVPEGKRIELALLPAAESAARNGQGDRLEMLLKPLGDRNMKEQERLQRIMSGSQKALKGGDLLVNLISSGQENVSGAPNDSASLNNAYRRLKVTGTSDAEIARSFLRVGTSLPPDLINNIKQDFENNDLEQAIGTLNSIALDDPNLADELTRRNGVKAVTARDEVNDINSTPQQRSNALEALKNPRADQLLNLAQQKIVGDTEVPPLDTDRVFAATIDSDGEMKLTSTQRRIFESKFRSMVVQNAISGDVSVQDIDSVFGRSASSAAEGLSGRFVDMNVVGQTQLLPLNYEIGTSGSKMFGHAELQDDINGKFRKFIRNELEVFDGFLGFGPSFEFTADHVDIRAHSPMESGSSLLIPAVGPNGVFAFLEYDKASRTTRILANSVNQGEYLSVRERFNSEMGRANLDVLAKVRRQPGQPAVAFEAGGRDLVVNILRIVNRRFEQDFGYSPDPNRSQSEGGDKEVYERYMDDIMTRAGYSRLMPESQ